MQQYSIPPPANHLPPVRRESARVNSLVITAYPWSHREMLSLDSLLKFIPQDHWSKACNIVISVFNQISTCTQHLVGILNDYELMLFNSRDDRHVGIQTLLHLPLLQHSEFPEISPRRNDHQDLFRYLFQLRMVDRLLIRGDMIEHDPENMQADMPVHIRAEKLGTSCKVSLTFRSQFDNACLYTC